MINLVPRKAAFFIFIQHFLQNSTMQNNAINHGMDADNTPMPRPIFIPPKLRSIPAALVAANNQLAAGRKWDGICWDQHWQAAILGSVLECEPDTSIFVSVSWKNIHGCLAFSRDAAASLLAAQYEVMTWDQISPDILLALLQQTADDLLIGFQPHFSGPIRINNWMPPQANLNTLQENLPLILELSMHKSFSDTDENINTDAPISCYFMMDLANAHKLAQQIGSLGNTNSSASYPPLKSGWGNLPISTWLELGWIDLPLNELNSLQPQDVLLPDGWWPGKEQDAFCLRLAPKLGAMAKLVEQNFAHVSTEVKKMEQETMINTDDDADSLLQFNPDNLGDIPVRITFDIGERQILLKELSKLAPGYIFDLGLAPEHAVNLRMNGVRIGEGELVEVNGQVGVSITRIMPPHKS